MGLKAFNFIKKKYQRSCFPVKFSKFSRTPIFKMCMTAALSLSQWAHTSNPRWFDVDITSRHRRPNFDEFPRHFRVLFRCSFDVRKIPIVCTYFFRRNFASRKIHVASTYFYWCNFAGQKIHVVCTYFFWCNFDGRKIHVVCTYFFWCNFDGRKISVFSTYFSWCNFSGRDMRIFLLTFFDVILMS